MSSRAAVAIEVPPVPPWHPRTFIAEAVARGFVGIDDGSAGGAFDLRLVYRPVYLLALRAGATVALGGGDAGGLFAGSAHAVAALELSWLELGVGVGFATLNDHPSNDPMGARELPTLVLRVRTGTEHGFHLDAQLHLGFEDDLALVTRFEGNVRAPVGDFQIGARGLGGLDGVVIGEAVLRWQPGPLGLHVSAGAAGVFFEPSCRSGADCGVDRYVGPSGGVGLRWLVD